MSRNDNALEVLNREFLDVRAKILEVAAALDRIERAEGSVREEPRYARIERGLAALAKAGPGRAEQVQMIFSLPYQERWQSEMKVESRR